jgi:hypothetical protein
MNKIVELLEEFINGAFEASVICEIERDLLREFAPEWWENNISDMLRREREADSDPPTYEGIPYDN